MTSRTAAGVASRTVAGVTSRTVAGVTSRAANVEGATFASAVGVAGWNARASYVA